MKKPIKYDIVYSSDVKLVATNGNAVGFANRTLLIDYIRESHLASKIRNLSCLPQTLQNLAWTPLVKSLHGQRGAAYASR